MKKRQVVLYVFIMLILLTTSVYATIEAKLGFKITKDYSGFYPGDEFIFTIKLTDFVASEGVKSIEGYIDIDENILENLSASSIVTDESGNVKIGTNTLPVYDANNISSSSEKGVIFNANPVSGKGDYKIVINLDNPISSDTDLVGIRFKIKEGATPGMHEAVMSYKLFNLFSTDAGEKKALSDETFRVKIEEGEPPVVNNTTNNTTNNTVNEIDNNTINNTANNTTRNNTVNNTANNTTRNNTVNNTARNNTVNNTANNTTRNNTVNNTANNTTRNNTVNNTARNNTTNNATNKNTAGTNNRNNAGSGNVTTIKKDSTVAPTNLPKTGYRIALIPLFALVIVGLVFYKKYSKYNNYGE